MADIIYDGGEIHTTFPQTIYQQQLRKVGASSEKELTILMMAKMMVNIIADFKQGSVSLDALSDMFGHLEQVYTNNKLSLRFDEIKDVLYKGGELTFIIRKVERPDSTSFSFYIAPIISFYNQREVVLKNIAEMLEEEKH